jgi:hypothetical protein
MRLSFVPSTACNIIGMPPGMKYSFFSVQLRERVSGSVISLSTRLIADSLISVTLQLVMLRGQAGNLRLCID